MQECVPPQNCYGCSVVTGVYMYEVNVLVSFSIPGVLFICSYIAASSGWDLFIVL
jgi:hypothetical protein